MSTISSPQEYRQDTEFLLILFKAVPQGVPNNSLKNDNTLQELHFFSNDEDLKGFVGDLLSENPGRQDFLILEVGKIISVRQDIRLISV